MEKLVYAARATRGHRFCGVSITLGGRDFLLLRYFLFKRYDNGFGCCGEGGGGGGGGGGGIAHRLMWDC